MSLARVTLACAIAGLLGRVCDALPSCDAETELNCVGEDADLSPEGISACLAALEAKSDDCTTYLKLMEACKADLKSGGVCGAAAMDGEAMPCLVQRTKPEDLSEACAAALPSSELKGLAKFWADGKRQLNINEITELNAEDKDVYNRWQKRKKGKKTDKDRERDYAVKQAKKERVELLIVAAVKEGAPASAAEATKLAQAEEKKLLSEDLTGTLKPMSKAEIERIAKDGFKAYRVAAKEKGEL